MPKNKSIIPSSCMISTHLHDERERERERERVFTGVEDTS